MSLINWLTFTEPYSHQLQNIKATDFNHSVSSIPILSSGQRRSDSSHRALGEQRTLVRDESQLPLIPGASQSLGRTCEEGRWYTAWNVEGGNSGSLSLPLSLLLGDVGSVVSALSRVMSFKSYSGGEKEKWAIHFKNMGQVRERRAEVNKNSRSMDGQRQIGILSKHTNSLIDLFIDRPKDK